MTESLFQDLKNIGISEDVAVRVSSALDPDHIATKQDVLVMQEALLQHQKQSMEQLRHMEQKTDERFRQVEQKADERYYELKTEMVKGFAEVRTEIADVRSEMGSMHRQYWITFGGLITTIFSVFVVNWYFHT